MERSLDARALRGKACASGEDMPRGAGFAPVPGAPTPLSTGVGLRRPGRKAPVAYGEVDIADGQFIRQPLCVLAWDQKVRCQEPETGD